MMQDDEFEDDEPCEGDYVMSPTGQLGGLTAVSQHGYRYLGTFREEEEAEVFILKRMEEHKFWPNVWKLSDHGNWIGPLDTSKWGL